MRAARSWLRAVPSMAEAVPAGTRGEYPRVSRASTALRWKASGGRSRFARPSNSGSRFHRRRGRDGQRGSTRPTGDTEAAGDRPGRVRAVADALCRIPCPCVSHPSHLRLAHRGPWRAPCVGIGMPWARFGRGGHRVGRAKAMGDCRDGDCRPVVPLLQRNSLEAVLEQALSFASQLPKGYKSWLVGSIRPVQRLASAYVGVAHGPPRLRANGQMRNSSLILNSGPPRESKRVEATNRPRRKEAIP